MIREGVVSMVSNKTIKLPDGRILSYYEFGDISGKPVFYFHGSGVASGMYAELLHDTALKTGIRLISPDRPGIGSSTYKPDRRLTEWPKDVEELANRLDISRFSIISESGGSAYAYACASIIPDRINKVAIVSGLCPLDIKYLQKDLTFKNRLSLRVLKSPEWLLKRMFSGLSKKTETGLETFFDKASKKSSDIEKRVLESSAFRNCYKNCVQNAFKQGTMGPVKDIKIVSGHWSFDLRKITCNISLWHGLEDESAPVSMTKRVQEMLENCQAYYFPKEGHISVIKLHAEEIFGSLS